jgi:hypothetical protein
MNELEPSQNETPELVVEEIDIEVYVLAKKPIPHAKRYVIRIDKEKRVVHTPELTGKMILELVGKTPDKFKLYEHFPGKQPQPIQPDQEVHLHKHHVERFTTMAKDTTEGRTTAALRRDFRLPLLDEQYLDSLGLPWEAMKDGGLLWLIVHDWNIDVGYNVRTVRIALQIPGGYSDNQIDMVYFFPALERADRRPIATISSQPIYGEIYQRWSRHRTPANPWRPGVDDISTHLTLVDEWLRRELARP